MKILVYADSLTDVHKIIKTIREGMPGSTVDLVIKPISLDQLVVARAAKKGDGEHLPHNEEAFISFPEKRSFSVKKAAHVYVLVDTVAEMNRIRRAGEIIAKDALKVCDDCDGVEVHVFTPAVEECT